MSRLASTRGIQALDPVEAIRGRVVNPFGAPVASAIVEGTWKRGDQPVSRRVATEANGAFELNDLDRDAQLLVRVRSVEHPTEEVSATAPDDHLVIVLREGRTIRARVHVLYARHEGRRPARTNGAG